MCSQKNKMIIYSKKKSFSNPFESSDDWISLIGFVNQINWLFKRKLNNNSSANCMFILSWMYKRARLDSQISLICEWISIFFLSKSTDSLETTDWMWTCECAKELNLRTELKWTESESDSLFFFKPVSQKDTQKTHFHKSDIVSSLMKPQMC